MSGVGRAVASVVDLQETAATSQKGTKNIL